MPRDVYTYTSDSAPFDSKILLAPVTANIGTTLTNIAEIENRVLTLYDKKGKAVGKKILNKAQNYFGDNTEGGLGSSVYLIDDGSYVVTLQYAFTQNGEPLTNSKTSVKAIASGGKYAGKDASVTVKYDGDKGRKVIIEYEK